MYNSVWYSTLPKPFLMPPNWLFAPVWTMLYVMMFVSFLIYTTTQSRLSKMSGYVYFLLQLLLNILWSPAFFVLKNVGLALIIIILLDIFVYLMIRKFHEVSRFSAITLYPYFIWILFATYLNLWIFIHK